MLHSTPSPVTSPPVTLRGSVTGAPSPLLLVSTATLAAAAALFAIALTRVVAFLQAPSAVLLLVGFAASGSAAGGLVAHRLCWLPSRAAGVVAAAAGLTAGFMVAAVATMVTTAGSLPDLVYEAAGFLAYAGTGAALAGAYGSRRGPMPTFAAQALGGGIMAALAPWLLDWQGPLTAALVAAGLAAIAGVLALVQALAARRGGDRVAELDSEGPGVKGMLRWGLAGLGALGMAGAIAALVVQLTSGWLVLDANRVNEPKNLFLSIHSSQAPETLAFSEWNSVGRFDITEPANTPNAKWAYRDGFLAGLMYRASNGGAAQAVQADIGNVPFLLPGAHDKVLVVGAGAGEEVLLSLAAGAKEIVVADSSVGLLRALGQFSEFSGNWMTNPAVRIVDLDGRTYLRSTTEQFDLIYVTSAANGAVEPSGTSGGNFLYTIDAVGDYLDHLRQDGRVVYRLRDEAEFLRAFNTTFQAVRRRGAAPMDAIRRLLGINNQAVAQQSGGGITLPLLIVRKTPFLEDEARSIFGVLQRSPFVPIFLPHQEQASPFGGWADEEYGPAFYESRAPYDIRPVSDASPFFFETDRGLALPLLIVPVAALLITGALSWLTRRPSGDALDAAGLDQAAAQAFLEDDLPWRYTLFAALVAAGFGLVHAALAFRLPLLLGRPQLDTAIGYGAFLVAAAIGALAASRVGLPALRPAIGWAGLVGGIVAVATVELLPMASASLKGTGEAARIAAGAAFVLPLGLCFGVPFASAARLLASNGRGGWVPLLWAVSAIAGVTGVFLSLFLGITFSFTVALALGAVCLFGGFLMAGLRYLPFDSPGAEPEVMAVETGDTGQFQRPAGDATV